LRAAFDLHDPEALDMIDGFVGGIAQLGERLHGMQEVSGSIPLTSTNETVTARLVPFV
jgi:hypothetical protein